MYNAAWIMSNFSIYQLLLFFYVFFIEYVVAIVITKCQNGVLIIRNSIITMPIPMQGAVLLTVGRSYVGNDITRPMLLDRACACSYENFPKYRCQRVSKTAPWPVRLQSLSCHCHCAAHVSLLTCTRWPCRSTQTSVVIVLSLCSTCLTADLYSLAVSQHPDVCSHCPVTVQHMSHC